MVKRFDVSFLLFATKNRDKQKFIYNFLYSTAEITMKVFDLENFPKFPYTFLAPLYKFLYEKLQIPASGHRWEVIGL